MRTRARVLDAAFDVFERVGFRAATVDEIMKSAGANRATFYLHFKDKHQVAGSLVDRSAAEVTQHYRLLDVTDQPTPAGVRQWVVDHIALRRQDRVLVLVVQEAATSDLRFGQRYLDYFDRLARRVMVNMVTRQPADRRAQFRAKIQCVFLMMQRMEFLCVHGDVGDDPPEPLIDAIAEILWNELFVTC